MDLYAEHILDHYRNPRNYGRLKNPTHTAKGVNPLCGDKIRIDLAIKNGRVSSMKFESEGCAISKAAMSMLAEIIPKKTPKQLIALKKEKMFKLLGTQPSPARTKCALLGFMILKKALQ